MMGPPVARPLELSCPETGVAGLGFPLLGFVGTEGHSPSLAHHRRRDIDPPDWAGAARWMAIGAGQAVVYGASALALAGIRSPRALEFTRRALEGAGKVLWMRPFRAPEYGATAAGPGTPASP